MTSDPLDDALTLFAATAPEFGPLGLSNHGPMAAEVLGQLGHADAIGAWVQTYRVHLDPAPPPAEKPLSEVDWPAALGRPDRFPEWLALFEREVADRPRPPSSASGPRAPLPGSVGAATHGLIRTGHAVRGLACGGHAAARLAGRARWPLWASQLRRITGPAPPDGHEGVAAALADLPYLPEDAPTPC